MRQLSFGKFRDGYRPWTSSPHHQTGTSPDLNPAENPLVETGGGPTIGDIPRQPSPPTGPGEATSTSTTIATAPPLHIGFLAQSFASTGNNNGGNYMIPPDPNAAVGLGYGVAVTNGVISWFTTQGQFQRVESLIKFFAPLSPLSNMSDPNQTSAFDPKVIYDAVNNRFIVVALEASDAGGGDSNTSRILVAVSKDGNPKDGWYYTAINSDVIANKANCWADFPGLATDGKAIYVTANLFSHSSGQYEGSRLWIIADGQSTGGLYAGGPATVNVYDPSVASGATSAGPNEFFSLIPAQMLSPAPGQTGTFLVSYNGARSTTAAGEALNVIRVDNPLGTPTFTYQQVNVGNIDKAAPFSSFTAPQKGSSTAIDAGDDRVLSVVYRYGSLYATTTILPTGGPDAGMTTAHWFRLSTSNLSDVTLANQGNINGASIGAGVRTYDASITVDAKGDFGVGFSASAPGLYAGAYYTVHTSADGPGIFETPQALAKGVAPYVRTFGGGANRWGDFSSIVPDPTNKSAFWVFNEFAQTQGTPISGETGQWGTRLGEFIVPSPTGAAPSSVAAPNSTGSHGLSLLVQAMAGFGGNGSAFEPAPSTPFSHDPGHQHFLAASHHPSHHH